MRISDWSSDVCSSDLTYLGSDALALASLTQRVIYLEEGDWVVCGHDKIQIYDQANQRVERAITQSGVDGELISKGNHRHYMIKEIYEQPIVVAQTLRSYLQRVDETLTLPIPDRSEEHTSELQSLMRISYAVFCLKKITT